MAWIPAWHILRMSPPMIMEDEIALKAMDIIEESIYETKTSSGIAVASTRCLRKGADYDGPDATIRFGVIGCGLMGREFASAAGRWCHLSDIDARRRSSHRRHQGRRPSGSGATCLRAPPPPSTATCWPIPRSTRSTAPCRTHLHAQMYVDIIEAGKHLMGEKPFGIDLAANQAIMAASARHPEVLVRCSSEFPFHPGAYQIGQWMREGRFGRIIEVEAGFWHSSDLDPLKPINWKRRARSTASMAAWATWACTRCTCRSAWLAAARRAGAAGQDRRRASGQKGGMVPCDTWDNAILACRGSAVEQEFPMLLSKRIAPGHADTWFIRIAGTAVLGRVQHQEPQATGLPYEPGAQAWHVTDVPYQTAYPVITGNIFEFGFSDSILQMWAAFCDELAHGPAMRQPF